MVLTRASDLELLSKARTSRRAFAVFYDRYERVIAGYFMRRTRDPELTADLTAEVFAAAFVAAGRYRAEAETVAPWLFTIAQHTLASSVRRGRVEEAARRELGVRAAVELGGRSVARLEQLVIGDAWVSELLNRLPADQREASARGFWRTGHTTRSRPDLRLLRWSCASGSVADWRSYAKRSRRDHEVASGGPRAAVGRRVRRD